MKKIFALLLILIISLTVLSGCDTTLQDTNGSQQPTSLPEDQDSTQSAGSEIPQPPALPEG